MFNYTIEGIVDHIVLKNQKVYDELSKNKELYEEYFEIAPLFFCLLWKMLTDEKTRELDDAYLPSLIIRSKSWIYDEFTQTINSWLLGISGEEIKKNKESDYHSLYKKQTVPYYIINEEITKLNNELTCVLDISSRENGEWTEMILDPIFIKEFMFRMYNHEFDEYFEKKFKKVIMEYHLKDKKE